MKFLYFVSSIRPAFFNRLRWWENVAADKSKCFQISPAERRPLFSSSRIFLRTGSERAFNVSCNPNVHSPPLFRYLSKYYHTPADASCQCYFEKYRNRIVCNSSVRSAHLLRWPYERVVAAGIQPIAKRFQMAEYVTVPWVIWTVTIVLQKPLKVRKEYGYFSNNLVYYPLDRVIKISGRVSDPAGYFADSRRILLWGVYDEKFWM